MDGPCLNKIVIKKKRLDRFVRLKNTLPKNNHPSNSGEHTAREEERKDRRMMQKKNIIELYQGQRGEKIMRVILYSYYFR